MPAHRNSKKPSHHQYWPIETPRGAASSNSRSIPSKLTDEPDFRREVNTELAFDLCLGERNEFPDIPRRCRAKVYDDVGVQMGNLGTSMLVSLESGPIDQSPSPLPFDFLEDRPGTWVPVQPWMTGSAPAEILLHDTMQLGGIAAREFECRGKRDFPTVVQSAGIVAESHIVAVQRTAPAGLIQDFSRAENLRDEHGSLTSGSGGQEVEVLPYGTADGAGNSGKVFETTPSAGNRFADESCDHGSRFRPEDSIVGDRPVSGDIPDDEASKTPVADEDIGT